jgi:predicted Zn-dependent protease
MRRFTQFLASAGLLTAGLGALPALAQNLPAVALPAPQSISATDKATGSKAHPDMVTEYGGAYTGPQSAIVRRVGLAVAKQSGIANVEKDFTFTLLNSPVENAFAIPGGYVYSTRALLALMNNEAELAFVLGHEVGHVAAHHSDSRNKVAQRNVLLGTLGQAVLGGILGNGTLGQLGNQLGQAGINRLATGNLMAHSRNDEFEADDLGTAFSQKAGYDPTSASPMLASLAAQTALDKKVAGNARSTPRWAMSHPDPEARVARALARARAMNVTTGKREADAFLLSLKGMIYGDDPKEGLIEGQTFRYPVGRLAFVAPDGYGISNGTTEVTIAPKNGAASAQATFTGGTYDGDLDNFVNAALAALNKGQSLNVTPKRGKINDIDAASATVSAQDANGTTQKITVVAYAIAPKKAFAFTVIEPEGSDNPLQPLLGSLRRMTDKEVADVRGRVIDVVTVSAKDTLASLTTRMAYTDMPKERFLVLNGLPADTVKLPVGKKVKLVVYGPAGKL